ncbi:N-6 DNA methylase [Eubacterium sp. AF17-7]|uniref:N-6 DNA methylase n=1 Tax=Eubacterium sp. AF17-7 TaxID=2293105 RepID=UPI000E539FEA|nr:N-6 DNA methylase [Eubacterium sp. AF17-7]RGG67398.1 N-6 DNA methylase [Eubacterium sp. AF17-7]
MNIRQWCINNIADFSNFIKSEEDMKVKVLIPYLESLGYSKEEFRYEHPIEVHIGTKKTTVFSDIEIIINDKVEMVIDAKRPSKALAEKDVLQVVSYAKLVDTPQAMIAVVTNGIDSVVTDTYSGQRSSEIPSRAQLLRTIDKSKKTALKDIELREVESILFTLHNSKELYKVIQDCKDVIETRGLIRSDQSFREMTKILLIKMNEERRVKAGEGNNRFTSEYILSAAKVNNISEIDMFKKLFEDAKEKYPSIYTDQNEQILISDELCIKHIIKDLEPFSFLGTGDDIKGTVYEIFLKSTLRGEFDQYFTPREIVDFMVKFADPNIGDIILDPACGSGGFLIQAFNHVNAKINTMRYSEVEGHNRYKDLVDKCLWGHEADYDLHVLAKINLIMHGDGWNNIYQGDTLSSDKIPDDYFDLILANPPFTIPYSFKDVLDKYELGIGKDSEELDILFVEKSIKALKPGCDLFIVLPEGLLNNKKYLYFRKWLLEKTDLLLSISLPEGAFIPFGGSVSKTCILGLRKKSDSIEYSSPGFAFLGKANEIGYEQGKKSYKQTEKNDLQEFEYMTDEVFEGIKVTSNDGECGWIEHNLITNYRIDANYLLNKIDKKKLEELYKEVIPLAEVCSVVNESVSVRANTIYNYLEVLDISPQTGSITNVRKVSGKEIGDSFHLFYGGDILFTRINPRINRVAIAPPVKPFGIMSKEIYRILYKKNKYISEENRYVICAILQNEWVIKQIIRLSTGSSSSRARVQVEDLLNDVYIPVLDEKVQKEISDSTYSVSKKLWNLSQKILKSYVKNQKILGGDVDKDQLRGI